MVLHAPIIQPTQASRRPSAVDLLLSTFGRMLTLYIINPTYMRRRTAVKQMIALTSGALLLPACGQPSREATVALDNLKVTGDLEMLLAEITETILPATNTPGAKDLKLPQFVLKMVDDCTGAEEQKAFEDGLAGFDAYAKENAGDFFEKLSVEDRKKVLLDLETQTTKKDSAPLTSVEKFYQTTKSLTIRGYLSAEPVMTNLTYYKMIPGRFDGCVEIKDPTDYKTIFG
jgi:hypothetical protein